MARQKCPDCAEKINADAIVCRFCGYRIKESDVIAAGNAAAIGTVVKVLVGFTAILGLSYCMDNGRRAFENGGMAPEIAAPAAPASSARDPLADAEIIPAAPARALRLDRFTWAAESDGICRASGQVTNTGREPLAYVQLTMEFTKGGALLGVETQGIATTRLPRDGTASWSAAYRCPGPGVSAKITATSDGEPVDLQRPAPRNRKPV